MSDSDSESPVELENLPSPTSSDLSEIEEAEEERDRPHGGQERDESEVESLSTECSYVSSTDDYEDYSEKYPELNFEENQQGLTIQEHSLYWVPGLPRLFNFSILDYGRTQRKRTGQRPTGSSSSSETEEGDNGDDETEADADDDDDDGKRAAKKIGSGHDSCKKSRAPYWIGCDSDCFKKRGKKKEKKLQAFLKNGSLRRGQNFR